jgi:hypothetical protein
VAYRQLLSAVLSRLNLSAARAFPPSAGVQDEGERLHGER